MAASAAAQAAALPLGKLPYVRGQVFTGTTLHPETLTSTFEPPTSTLNVSVLMGTLLHPKALISTLLPLITNAAAKEHALPSGKLPCFRA